MKVLALIDEGVALLKKGKEDLEKAVATLDDAVTILKKGDKALDKAVETGIEDGVSILKKGDEALEVGVLAVKNVEVAVEKADLTGVSKKAMELLEKGLPFKLFRWKGPGGNRGRGTGRLR